MSFFASIISNPVGLWWAAMSCTAAAGLTWWGAVLGARGHRVPRLFLAAAVTVIAFSYWMDVLGLLRPGSVAPGAGAEVRRGAGWLLWPALALTAWSGVKFGRRSAALVMKLTDMDGDQNR